MHGQLQLVVIHGLMAAHKKQDALPLLDQLIKFGEQQFHYGKTNVLGFGYLFSACVCYHFLGEEDSFHRVSFLIQIKFQILKANIKHINHTLFFR